MNLSTFARLATGLSLGLALVPACKKKPKPEPKAEAPAPAKAPEPEPESTEPVHIDLSGPKPPAVSATFFTVNGALMPIACYDAASKELKGGAKCGNQVPANSEVYLGSETGAQLDEMGAKKNSLCEAAGSKSSYGSASLDSGSNYDFGVWPRSTASLIQLIPARSQSPRKAKLDDAQSAAMKKVLVKLAKTSNHGEMNSNQKVEIDIDGDGNKELFISATLNHPRDPDQILVSGLWMAPGGDLNKLQLIDKSRGRLPETVVLRGLVDLDGDGRSEVWATLLFEGGAGDRLYRWQGNKVAPLAKWSCGA